VRTEESRLRRLRDAEIWIAWIRLGGVAFALFEVGFATPKFPPGYRRDAWILTAIFGAGSLALFALARRRRPEWTVPVGLAALVFDTLVIAAYATLFSYEYGSPTRWTMIFVVVEAAVRFGLAGVFAISFFLVPFFVFVEWWRAHHFGPPGFVADRVTFPVGVHLLTGLIVGRLVNRLDHEATIAGLRAVEAEDLRDALGRRVDVLDAANRCARALGSSLEMDDAFHEFIRELRGLVPFDRTAIVLADGDRAHVMATAGAGADEIFPPGSARPVTGSLLEHVLEGQTVYRPDLRDPRHPEEAELVELGLYCRLAAPLLLGARTIGMLSVVRAEADSFTAEEIELVSLLGRLVATAVQNMRAYEAERSTVEELRRLSALRADFVSLVSHELRSPMATVIGSARTLQARWDDLQPAQRASFLGLIADETDRLAELVSDVLDTSRIEAGTFSFTFTNVDLAELLLESVEHSRVAQEEVAIETAIHGELPRVRGDRERLRQLLANLIDNAVKYSVPGGRVEVSAESQNGAVRVEVRDEGAGIALDQQEVIFEKFGRAADGQSKPGTGLGLFIARSIAEAHGGSLDVRSSPQRGATFTLSLPLG
jgi:signal transduction histidine kinase